MTRFDPATNSPGPVCFAGRLMPLLLSCALACAPGGALAKERSPASTATTEKGGRSDAPSELNGKLPNGLAYHIEKAGTAGGETSFRLIVRVGHLHGLPEQQVAHVVEHIVVEKLQDRTVKGSIWDRAARLGARVNGGTGDLVTSYYFDLPASDPDAAAEALAILLDWATPATLSDEEIDRERKAVIEEARQGGYGEENRLGAVQLAKIFPGNIGLATPRDPIGTLSATPGSIRALYRDYYVPSNMALVIVGDVDPAATLRSITARLSSLPPGKVPRTAGAEARPLLRGGNYVPMKRMESDETNIALVYKMPPAATVVDRARRTATIKLADILVREAFVALAERRERTMAGSLSFANGPPSLEGRSADYLTIGAAIGRRTSRAALSDTLLIGAALTKHGFSPAEVTRAKAGLLSATAATSRVQEIAERWTGYYSDGVFEPGTTDVRAAIERLTATDVNRALKAWLDPAHRDIFLLYPGADAASVPTAEELPELLAAAEHAAPFDISRAAPRELQLDLAPVDTGGEVSLPAPAAEAEGFLRWTLPQSGATLLFRRQDGGSVRLTMRRPGGAARFDDRFAMGARAIPEIVASSGTGGLSGSELTRYLQERGLRLSASASATHEQISASGPTAEWPLILGVVRERARNRICGEKAFRTYVESARDALALKGDAGVVDAFNRAVDDGVGAKWRPDAADLDAMDLPAMCDRYREMFGDTAGTTIVVEGNVDAAAVYHGALEALDKAPAKPKPEVALRAKPQTIAGRTLVRRGTKPSARVMLMIAVNADAPYATVMAEPLQLAIFRRLRSEEKGTYAPAAGVGGSEPGRVILSIYFECAPENVDRLIAAAKDEIDKLGKAGPSAADIAAWRARSAGKVRDASAVADAWNAKRSLAPAPAASDAEIGSWVRDYFRSSRLHEFVLLPVE